MNQYDTELISNATIHALKGDTITTKYIKENEITNGESIRTPLSLHNGHN